MIINLTKLKRKVIQTINKYNTTTPSANIIIYNCKISSIRVSLELLAETNCSNSW